MDASDIPENDLDELELYTEQRPPWVTLYNNSRGSAVASLKTALMHRSEAVQKAKELALTIFVPPK